MLPDVTFHNPQNQHSDWRSTMHLRQICWQLIYHFVDLHYHSYFCSEFFRRCEISSLFYVWLGSSVHGCYGYVRPVVPFSLNSRRKRTFSLPVLRSCSVIKVLPWVENCFYDFVSPTPIIGVVQCEHRWHASLHWFEMPNKWNCKQSLEHPTKREIYE